MPRRKKKFMLLRSIFGTFIVVGREWYDSVGIPKQRGDRKRWWIVAESNDHGAMQAMASLTDKHLKMEVNHETEIITAERVTNVSDVVFKWELNCKQER